MHEQRHELRKHVLYPRNSKQMWLILPTVGGREEEWEKIELKNNIKPDEGH